MSSALAIVVFGVTGSGKSIIASELSRKLNCDLIEADQLHDPIVAARIFSGRRLSNEDRLKWLHFVCDKVLSSSSELSVVAISAIKRGDRDLLRRRLCNVRFIFLDGAADQIAARLAEQNGDEAGVKLLEVHLEELEPPRFEEGALRISVGQTPDDIVSAIVPTFNAQNLCVESSKCVRPNGYSL